MVRAWFDRKLESDRPLHRLQNMQKLQQSGGSGRGRGLGAGGTPSAAQIQQLQVSVPTDYSTKDQSTYVEIVLI